ncbi:MAG: DUF2490 domain-containing protein [Erythrobacter sp.]|nr:DUF2490 domain-containing protein [Erythrobacter sp.]
MKRMLIAAILAVSWAGAAKAQEEDTQFWLSASARTDLDTKTFVTLDGSLRFREDAARGGDERQARVTFEREIADKVYLGGGAGVWEGDGGFTELRPHQQIVVIRGPLLARTRLEQRVFDGADRVEIRFRQQVQLASPLGERTQAVVSGEWLRLLQKRSDDPTLFRTEWAGRAAVVRQVGERLFVGAAYIGIWEPRRGLPDRLAHVPQVTVDLVF